MGANSSANSLLNTGTTSNSLSTLYNLIEHESIVQSIYVEEFSSAHNRNNITYNHLQSHEKVQEFGNYRILRSTITNEKVQGYEILFHEEVELRKYLESYFWRKECSKNQSITPLVCSRYIMYANANTWAYDDSTMQSSTNQNQRGARKDRNDMDRNKDSKQNTNDIYCSRPASSTSFSCLNLFSPFSSPNGMMTFRVFIEDIPYRLSHIKDVPLPENLYLLKQSLRGFEIIYKLIGYVKPAQDLICINRKGIVKVWMNSNLSKNYPNSQNIEYNRQIMRRCGLGRGGSESRIIREIVEMICQNTSANIEPNFSSSEGDFQRDSSNRIICTAAPSILDYIAERYINLDYITFEKMFETIEQFAKEYEIMIPQYFESILELIKTEEEEYDTYKSENEDNQEAVDVLMVKSENVDHGIQSRVDEDGFGEEGQRLKGKRQIESFVNRDKGQMGFVSTERRQNSEHIIRREQESNHRNADRDRYGRVSNYSQRQKGLRQPQEKQGDPPKRITKSMRSKAGRNDQSFNSSSRPIWQENSPSSLPQTLFSESVPPASRNPHLSRESSSMQQFHRNLNKHHDEEKGHSDSPTPMLMKSEQSPDFTAERVLFAKTHRQERMLQQCNADPLRKSFKKGGNQQPQSPNKKSHSIFLKLDREKCSDKQGDGGDIEITGDISPNQKSSQLATGHGSRNIRQKTRIRKIKERVNHNDNERNTNGGNNPKMNRNLRSNYVPIFSTNEAKEGNMERDPNREGQIQRERSGKKEVQKEKEMGENCANRPYQHAEQNQSKRVISTDSLKVPGEQLSRQQIEKYGGELLEQTDIKAIDTWEMSRDLGYKDRNQKDKGPHQEEEKQANEHSDLTGSNTPIREEKSHHRHRQHVERMVRNALLTSSGQEDKQGSRMEREKQEAKPDFIGNGLRLEENGANVHTFSRQLAQVQDQIQQNNTGNVHTLGMQKIETPNHNRRVQFTSFNNFHQPHRSQLYQKGNRPNTYQPAINSGRNHYIYNQGKLTPSSSSIGVSQRTLVSPHTPHQTMKFEGRNRAFHKMHTVISMYPAGMMSNTSLTEYSIVEDRMGGMGGIAGENGGVGGVKQIHQSEEYPFPQINYNPYFQNHNNTNHIFLPKENRFGQQSHSFNDLNKLTNLSQNHSSFVQSIHNNQNPDTYHLEPRNYEQHAESSQPHLKRQNFSRQQLNDIQLTGLNLLKIGNHQSPSQPLISRPNFSPSQSSQNIFSSNPKDNELSQLDPGQGRVEKTGRSVVGVQERIQQSHSLNQIHPNFQQQHQTQHSPPFANYIGYPVVSIADRVSPIKMKSANSPSPYRFPTGSSIGSPVQILINPYLPHSSLASSHDQSQSHNLSPRELKNGATNSTNQRNSFRHFHFGSSSNHNQHTMSMNHQTNVLNNKIVQINSVPIPIPIMQIRQIHQSQHEHDDNSYQCEESANHGQNSHLTISHRKIQEDSQISLEEVVLSEGEEEKREEAKSMKISVKDGEEKDNVEAQKDTLNRDQGRRSEMESSHFKQNRNLNQNNFPQQISHLNISQNASQDPTHQRQNNIQFYITNNPIKFTSMIFPPSQNAHLIVGNGAIQQNSLKADFAQSDIDHNENKGMSSLVAGNLVKFWNSGNNNMGEMNSHYNVNGTVTSNYAGTGSFEDNLPSRQRRQFSHCGNQQHERSHRSKKQQPQTYTKGQLPTKRVNQQEPYTLVQARNQPQRFYYQQQYQEFHQNQMPSNFPFSIQLHENQNSVRDSIGNSNDPYFLAMANNKRNNKRRIIRPVTVRTVHNVDSDAFGSERSEMDENFSYVKWNNHSHNIHDKFGDRNSFGNGKKITGLPITIPPRNSNCHNFCEDQVLEQDQKNEESPNHILNSQRGSRPLIMSRIERPTFLERRNVKNHLEEGSGGVNCEKQTEQFFNLDSTLRVERTQSFENEDIFPTNNSDEREEANLQVTIDEQSALKIDSEIYRDLQRLKGDEGEDGRSSGRQSGVNRQQFQFQGPNNINVITV